MKFFQLPQHGLVAHDVGLELLPFLSLELLKELLAPLWQLHLVLVLVQQVQGLSDDLEGVLRQLQIVVVYPFCCIPR